MAEELRNKLEKAELWKGMEDDSDGYMTGEEMCKLEDGLLQAYIDDKAGQEAAAVPSATMESQAPWGWGESLAQPSLMDTEGEQKKVHNVVSWSLFRDVCAVLLDHVTAPTLSTSLDAGESGSVTQREKAKRQRSPWIALATAHLKTGGGKVVEESPCLLPSQLKNKFRRLSDSGKKKRAADQIKGSLAGKGVTHMVCCERLLKSDRAEVERKLKTFDLDTEAVSVVTDQWITNCFRCRKLLPITDENLFSRGEERHPQTKKRDAQLRTFVSAPFPTCKEPDDRDSPEWMVIKVMIDEEVDDDDNLLEYLSTIEITDGVRSWHASLSDYSQFASEGKLEGECLKETWSRKVCEVLRFPWGATIQGLSPPVDECRWKLSSKDPAQDWGMHRKDTKEGR